MREVKIIIDSSVDLPKEYINKHNIDVVPFYILFNEDSYRDGVDITTKQMYEKVKETGSLPKTAAVSPLEFETLFKKYIDKNMDVFVLTISSDLSSNYQNAYIASLEFEEGRVVVADSKALSGSIGLLTLKAIDLKEKGLSAVEINEEIQKLIPKMHTQFVIKTLEYLHKGGRCSTLARFAGAMLSLKIQIKMTDGKLHAFKKTPGKMSRAVNLMLEDFFKLAEEGKLDTEYVFITHSVAPLMEKLIKEEIEKRGIKIKNLITSEAGTVISSHCGEGTIGVLYLEK